jgi:chromosome segregation protein
MLKLKRVELQGFKSFCDRTELKFSGSGIAAVVGPNGCGKSNLSDAITWVLGEQSAKSLRGARMEDVIFAGTKSRKAVGMAAVTMVLSDPRPPALLDPNPEGQHPGAPETAPNVTTLPKPADVTITRRLFRSGESEYLIDGRTARLRDIQDIFMGSGLGPESYAIIEQGRIGQILSSKPYDRRAIIEEAAGITKYKSRKRLAEAKLESAKQNLSRVFDILEEVTRQVNSLKRQAAKAKRYVELKQELDLRLRTLIGVRFRALDEQAKSHTLALEEASSALKHFTETATVADAERAEKQAVCYRLEAELTEIRKQLSEIKLQHERTRGKLESQVRESGVTEQRMSRGEDEIKDLETRIAALDTERAALRETFSQLEEQIAASRAQLIEKNQAREQLQNRLREQEKVIEANRIAALRLLGEASSMKNQLAQIDEYLAGVDREKARVEREEQLATEEIARLTEARKSLETSIADRQLELESVTVERRQTEAALSAQRALSQQMRGAIDNLRGETSRLRAKKESLENVISHHTYTTDAVKRLFGAVERKQAGTFQPLGVLADFVDVDPSCERAAEEFLHNELEYVVVENWDQAEQGMQLFRADLEGRATFLVENAEPASAGGASQAGASEESSAAGQPTPDLPRLASLLRLTNGLSKNADVLLPRLAQCFLAPDQAEARRCSEAFPEFYFLLADGQCYHGRTLSGGHKKASGPLALKRELREISKAFAEQERELTAKSASYEQLTKDIAQLELDLDQLRQLQQNREKDALALGHEMRKLTEESGRANSRVSVARLDLERLRREQERAIGQRETNQAAIEQKENERSEREIALDNARQELESVDSEAARIREEHSTLRAELATLEERHRAAGSGLSRLEQQLREMANRREQLGREIERLGEHRSRLLAENIELDQAVAALAEQALQLDGSAVVLAQEEATRRQELQAADEALKEVRRQIETAHGQRSEFEVALVKSQSELKFLDETSRKELNVSADSLVVAETPEGEPDLHETERLYNELRLKIENLGPINPQALEEFDEAQQRHDFLSSQRQDLLDSIRDTEKAIQEIDIVSRTRFEEAFTVINENFKVAFQTLFGGGSGEMRLTDESNALESGIDIIASPPGKKLQNVLLLSGGEKALAALSLLMAIFKYQPSPFCVLDEVDAPLDEANIGRMMNLIKEMAIDTQFIIITHSKKTMEAAQAMYGVTMQEAGVSKLVSVRFHSHESPQPAVA